MFGGVGVFVKVLRDFLGGTVSGETEDADASAAIAATWEDRLAAWCGAHSANAKVCKKDKARMGSIDYLINFDRFIMSFGFLNGSNTFVPLRRVCPLRKDEEQYFMDGDDLQDMHGGVLKAQRACIENKTTGARFIRSPQEKVDGAPQNPRAMHIFHDQAPQSWPGFVCLFKDIGVRGVLEPDRWHITWGPPRSLVHSLAFGASCSW